MESDEISYEKIREILQKCRKKEVIELPLNFYTSAKAYLDSLNEKYSRESDGLSPKARSIIDNIYRMRKDLEEIYDLREGFVINAATIKARGGEAEDVKNFTPDEKKLMAALIETLKAAREGTLVSREDKKEEPKKEENKELTVIVLEDLPAFVSEDRKNHRLNKGDVVTLPAATAQLLIRNKKARVIE